MKKSLPSALIALTVCLFVMVCVFYHLYCGTQEVRYCKTLLPHPPILAFPAPFLSRLFGYCWGVTSGLPLDSNWLEGVPLLRLRFRAFVLLSFAL